MPLQGQPATEERLRHEIIELDAQTREMLSLYEIVVSERPGFIAAFGKTVREIIAPAMRSFCTKFPKHQSWFIVNESNIYDRTHVVPVSLQISNALPWHRFGEFLSYSIDPGANMVVVTRMSYYSLDDDSHSDTVRHCRLHEVTPLQVERDCFESFHGLSTALREITNVV